MFPIRCLHGNAKAPLRDSDVPDTENAVPYGRKAKTIKHFIGSAKNPVAVWTEPKFSSTCIVHVRTQLVNWQHSEM